MPRANLQSSQCCEVLYQLEPAGVGHHTAVNAEFPRFAVLQNQALQLGLCADQ